MEEGQVIPVKVALRIRPLVSKETREGCQVALEKVENEPQVHILNTNKCFTYDYAYGDESEQEHVYQEAIRPILENLFKGINERVRKTSCHDKLS
ncbi:chromosome-associated kinesin KIF4 [Eurytemora carolleeae]|uniref:chromosome-associated kinesin KIF4 n=1 Tax=Eurytemora carolleeae TaxID=1294199 RepID=UPI000C75E7CE|nr:chromosome-associated kinesin KIF4 [Eurytemora carolleeae]|eukprot:XP_023322864.1 chromosome-associated kinesin KIF4-like [Eurytemora affinis]